LNTSCILPRKSYDSFWHLLLSYSKVMTKSRYLSSQIYLALWEADSCVATLYTQCLNNHARASKPIYCNPCCRRIPGAWGYWWKWNSWTLLMIICCASFVTWWSHILSLVQIKDCGILMASLHTQSHCISIYFHHLYRKKLMMAIVPYYLCCGISCSWYGIQPPICLYARAYFICKHIIQL